MKKFFALILTFTILSVPFTARAGILDDWLADIRGELRGIGYTIDCFDNFGEKTATFKGDRISVSPNKVYDMLNQEYVMSSVLTITIDGSQIASCGDTLIFYEDGLLPDYDFTAQDINSTSDSSFVEAPFIAKTINDIKNMCGKPMIAVIKSQTGALLYAFSGNDVYWEVPRDLPKMTSLVVDGKRIYIHRANYQIIDEQLLEE